MSILDSFSLKGKVALVTGASYGIGMAVAAAYAGAGTTIVFSDLRPVLVFSGGGTLEARMEKSVLPHVFSFEKKRVSWVKLRKLHKDESDPSPFPALSQIEVFGSEPIRAE